MLNILSREFISLQPTDSVLCLPAKSTHAWLKRLRGSRRDNGLLILWNINTSITDQFSISKKIGNMPCVGALNKINALNH